MRTTRWMLAVLLLLGALTVPCQAIIITCDDICTCNSSCNMPCKIDGFTPSHCSAIGTCRGGDACIVAAVAPVTTESPQQCSAGETTTRPVFLATAPAQP